MTREFLAFAVAVGILGGVVLVALGYEFRDPMLHVIAWVGGTAAVIGYRFYETRR